MVHRASATDWRGGETDDDRRTIDIRVLNHMQKCSGFDTLAALDQLEPPSLQQQPSRDGDESSLPSFQGSSQPGSGSRVRGRAIDWRHRTARSSFDGLLDSDSSPTSLNDSDPIAQLPLEKWTIKEVSNGRPARAVLASPLDRLEGTFDLAVPHETVTLSTGYSRLNPERWLKYLHQSSAACSLQLDARLGSAEQLTTVAEAITALVKQQQHCPDGGNPSHAPPNAVSIASNNLGYETVPLICSLCEACPELRRLDLSHNRHLFSAPLELDGANKLMSLFFSTSSSLQASGFSNKPSVAGQLSPQDANVLDAPVPEDSAVTGPNINISDTGSQDYTVPSALQSLALNGCIIGASMSGLISGCLLHQQHSNADTSNAFGLQELHLQDAEMDAVAFSTLLWGLSARPSQQGSSRPSSGLRTASGNSSRSALRCASRPASASGVSSADSGSLHRQSLIGGLRAKSNLSSSGGVSSTSATLKAASNDGSSDAGNDSRLGQPTWLHRSDNCRKQAEAPLVHPALAAASGTASALKGLRVLNLAGCLQAGKQLSVLASMIASSCSLEDLNLADIGASPSGYQRLSSALWTNSSLVKVSVAGGDFSWAAVLCLSLAVMRHQPSLKNLDVSRCRLPALGFAALLKAAATSGSLAQLHFAGVSLLKSSAAEQAVNDVVYTGMQPSDSTAQASRTSLLKNSPTKAASSKQEATAITGGSSKLGLKVDKAARVSAVFVQQKQSLDTQVAILSKSQSLAAAHAGSSMPKFVRRGAKLVSRVMGNTVGAASKQQSSAQDGDESRSASHTFDLSSLDGWSSATNCFSLHVAGCVQCTCVQVQVPVASLGSRKYKALLSRDQLEDPRAVAQFSGEMQQSGMLKVTVSLGSEGPLEPSSSVAIRELGTPDVSEELFTCIYQEMEGRLSSSERGSSGSRRARPIAPDGVWRNTIATAFSQSGAMFNDEQRALWRTLFGVGDH